MSNLIKPCQGKFAPIHMQTKSHGFSPDVGVNVGTEDGGKVGADVGLSVGADDG